VSTVDLVALLRRSTSEWNAWRARHQSIRPSLREAQLEGADLRGANLSRVDLSGACLSKADLEMANLRGTVLRAADLTSARLNGADISAAHVEGAVLHKTDLSGVRAIETHLERALLHGCRVYGISAWGVHLEETQQKDLIITGRGQPVITVDDLEVAQFVHMMLRNQKMQSLLTTVTTKVILLLGRFTKERKLVLDGLREELALHDYIPILFDFERPKTRNLTEAVSTLAHLARFIIADITSPRSIPQELQRIVPQLPSVPIQPVLHESEDAYGMFDDFFDSPTVLEPVRYRTVEQLRASLPARIIGPAEALARSIERKRVVRAEVQTRRR
jgi:hypothetical protein